MFASRLKHPAGTWVDPMQSPARITFHRLICLRIIGDRWIIGPALHLLAGVGAAVDENGHDVRLTCLSMTTLDLAQLCFGRFLFARTVRVQ
jgi:hypothetical protein